MSGRFRACVLAFVLVCVPFSARAEPTAAEKASARTMLDDGYALLPHDPAQALKLFLAADATMKVPTTALAVARGQAAMGRLVDANETLAAVERMPASAGDPPAFARAREDAGRLRKEVDARLPTVRIDVDAAGVARESITLRIDGETLPRSALGAPHRIDPGHHVIVVSSGAVAVTRELTVAERENTSVAIRLGEHVAPNEAPPPSRGPSPLVYVGFGVAGVGVAVGSVTGILAIAKKSSSTIANNCPENRCSPAAHGDVDTVKALATTSTISFLVAGAGAALGGVGLLLGGGRSTNAATISPYVTGTGAGMRGNF